MPHAAGCQARSIESKAPSVRWSRSAGLISRPSSSTCTYVISGMPSLHRAVTKATAVSTTSFNASFRHVSDIQFAEQRSCFLELHVLAEIRRTRSYVTEFEQRSLHSWRIQREQDKFGAVDVFEDR